MMTSRQRLSTVLAGKIPDCVPVAPDFSNMIPARRTGKPFWDLYLYSNPPIWDAYIDCAKHFNIDSLMDGYFPFRWPSDPIDPVPWENFIVQRDGDRIVTRAGYAENGRRVWNAKVNVFQADNPPNWGVPPAKVGLPDIPVRFEPVEGVVPMDRGIEGLRRVKRLMGDQGLVGVSLISTIIIGNEEAVYQHADHPEKIGAIKAKRLETVERRFRDLMAMQPGDRPDFLCVGGSGTLIFQSPDFFREHVLPAVKRAIELASAADIPTHVHSCGPEKDLVRILTEETSLTVIDPLEIPPMGNCDLADLKRVYGDRVVLKGNLHTTEVMLKGSRDDVEAASRKAIDDAAEGGRFILSTGDQCGRDTPEENLTAMVETARTYGRY